LCIAACGIQGRDFRNGWYCPEIKIGIVLKMILGLMRAMPVNEKPGIHRPLYANQQVEILSVNKNGNAII